MLPEYATLIFIYLCSYAGTDEADEAVITQVLRTPTKKEMTAYVEGATGRKRSREGGSGSGGRKQLELPEGWNKMGEDDMWAALCSAMKARRADQFAESNARRQRTLAAAGGGTGRGRRRSSGRGRSRVSSRARGRGREAEEGEGAEEEEGQEEGEAGEHGERVFRFSDSLRRSKIVRPGPLDVGRAVGRALGFGGDAALGVPAPVGVLVHLEVCALHLRCTGWRCLCWKLRSSACAAYKGLCCAVCAWVLCCVRLGAACSVRAFRACVCTACLVLVAVSAVQNCMPNGC